MRIGIFDKQRNGRTYCIYRKGLIDGRSQSPTEARTLHGRLQTNTLRRPGHILKNLAFYSTIHSQAISTVFAKVTTQPQALLRPYTWRVEKFTQAYTYFLCSQEDTRPGLKWPQP